jgi:hypothetical protein
LVTPGSGTVVDTPRVPEDDITRSGLDLLPGAAAVVEPLELALGRKVVGIPPCPALLRHELLLVSLKVLIVEREGALEDHETAVVGTVLGEVHDALDAVLEATVGGLVDVGPSGSTVALEVLGGKGEGNVHAI